MASHTMLNRASEAPGTEAAAVQPNIIRGMSAVALRYGMVWMLVVILIGAQLAYPGFLDWTNIQILFSQAAPVGIVAVGMTFVMIAGGFDLSVGGTFGFAAVFFANKFDSWGLWGAGAATVLIGAAFGAVNGLVVTRLKVNAFVATLGTGSVFGGFAYLFSHSAPQTPTDLSFGSTGLGTWLGLPISIWILLAALVIGGFVLHKGVYGRTLYAVGGNAEAARLAGLRVSMARGSTYVWTGAFAALGGLILASRLSTGEANMGTSVPLDAIAIVVIGGTSLLGGEGAMWRTAIGLTIIGTLTNVFSALAIDSNWQAVVKGAVVVAAVALDLFARSRAD
jgi:ribose transport system permease protein